MNKTKEHKIEKKADYIVIDGKYYQPSMIRGKHVFKPVSKKEVDSRIKKANEIAECLKDGLDTGAVMREVLMKIDPCDLDSLYNMVKSKRKYKPKTREDRCVDMTYGNFIIPIVD